MNERVDSLDDNGLSNVELAQIDDLRSHSFFARKTFPIRINCRLNSVVQTGFAKHKSPDDSKDVPVASQMLPAKRSQSSLDQESCVK